MQCGIAPLLAFYGWLHFDRRFFTVIAISNAFARIALAAGVKVRLHDLRHTAATWTLQGGIDVRTVAEVLGHTDASTTLRTYFHVLPGATDRAVDLIALRLRQPNGNRAASDDAQIAAT